MDKLIYGIASLFLLAVGCMLLWVFVAAMFETWPWLWFVVPIMILFMIMGWGNNQNNQNEQQ
jgi:hypothetical protein